MVVEEDDIDLDAFLQGGDEFLGHHQVGAVTDHDVDLALGRGHFGADAAGDLVPHAGVAVLQVEAARLPGAPELVQVAGQAAGSADDDVLRLGEVIDDADDVALPQRNGIGGGSLVVGLGDPLRAPGVNLRAEGRRDAVSGRGLGQFLKHDPGIALQGQRGVLVCVELGHVDVDEADVRVLELRLGGQW